MIEEQLKQQFKDFLKEDIPKHADNYEWRNNQVLVKIFQFRPKADSKSLDLFLDASGKKRLSDLKVRHFPIGKVLACGPDSSYEKGDIVKFRDGDFTQVYNEEYEAWVNNEYSNALGVKKIGQEPPKMKDGFSRFLSQVFITDPLKLEWTKEDYQVLRVSDPIIECKIKNPNELVH